MSQVERSAARDAAIEGALPNVAFDGWGRAALRHSGVADADILFPGGATDMIEAYCDWADRMMAVEAAASMPDGLRLPARVRFVIAVRLRQNRPYREAIRRALGVLAVPGNAALAARITARSVDAIWLAAGDKSADFSWYTKRAILAGVYGSTLLFWLRDPHEDDAASLEFLDRRLQGVAMIGKLRGRAEGMLGRFVPRRFRTA